MTSDPCFLNLRKMIPESEMTDAELRKEIDLARNVQKYHPKDYMDIIAENAARRAKGERERAISDMVSAQGMQNLRREIDSMFYNTTGMSAEKRRLTGLEAKLSGVQTPGVGTNVSVDKIRSAHAGAYTGEVTGVREKYNLSIEDVTDPKLSLDTRKELWNIVHKIKGFATDNKVAQEFAAAMKKSYDMMFKDYASHHHGISYLEHYMGWRKYDILKVIDKGVDAFVQMVTDPKIVDFEKTYYGMTNELIVERAKEMYEHIIGGNTSDFSKHRSIHFVSPEAEEAWSQAYALHPSQFMNWQAQVSVSASQIALMDVFGPSYRENFERLLKWAEPDKNKAFHSTANNMFRELAGDTTYIVDSKWRRTARTAILAESAMNLGGTVTSALLIDQANAAALVSSVDGRGVLPTLAKELKTYFSFLQTEKGVAARNKAAEMMLVNVYHKVTELLTDAQDITGAAGKLEERLAKRVQWMFDKSGMQSHSEAVRASVAVSVGNVFTDYHGMEWDQLPGELKSTFNRFAIGPMEWHIIQKSEMDLDGIRVYSPWKLRNVPLEGVSPLMQRKTMIKYGALINDYAKLATLESDPMSRQLIYHGTVDGSFWGINARLFGTFKQAGIQTMRLQKRLFYDMTTANYAQACILFGAFGFLTNMLRDMVMKGRTPQWPDTDTDEGVKMMSLQVIDGINKGMGGLFLDTLTAPYNMNYRSFAGDIVGPVYGDVGAVLKTVDSAARGEFSKSKEEAIMLGRKAVAGAIPGANFPVVKGFITEPALDAVHNLMSSSYDTNMQTKLRKTRQRRIVKSVIKGGR